MKAHIVSLGCPKNLVDTEQLMTKLASEGYSFTNQPKDADLIVVNTCAFVKSARAESLAVIEEMQKWRQQGKHLIVAGCLPEYLNSSLKTGGSSLKADAFIGVPERFTKLKALTSERRIKATPAWTSYLKISEGCNNNCSYCTVPTIRGRLRHKPVKDILAEAKLLVASGIKEIILVAEETTMYPRFAKLLSKLCRISKLRWLRIMYAHPAHVTDELIRIMAREPKIVKYLDLPIQHADDKILKSMKRRYNRRTLENLISKIRRQIPKIALRTTVIVGYPGEGEAEFQALLAFIKQVRFQKLGAFAYSRETGTLAAKLGGQVPGRIKASRLSRIMRAQSRVSRELNKSMIGQTLEILVEGAGFGRCYLDAPEIDGQVFFRPTKSTTPGEIRRVRVTGASTYDLTGVLI